MDLVQVRHAISVHPMTYYAIGFEVGAQGTPHLQMYLEFRNPISFSSLRKQFHGAHIEVRRGSCLQAYEYCLKENHPDNFYSDKPSLVDQKGKRTDLIEFVDIMKISYQDAIEEKPEVYVKYANGLNSLQYKMQQHRDPDNPPIVTWYYGKAGCGKTRRVYENHEISEIYTKPANKWWDGYTQQPVILIDDFSEDFLNYRDFLTLIDRYPTSREVKGGTVKINSRYIYITCEFHPKYLFTKSENHLEQVTRRIHAIIEVRKGDPDCLI